MTNTLKKTIKAIGRLSPTKKGKTKLDKANDSKALYVGNGSPMALADALKDNGTLRLSHTHIGEECARAIAKVLKNNSTLVRLDLRHNNIDEGAKILAKALKKNKTVMTLSLYGNWFGDDGAKILANVLKKNSSITFLDLSCNGIGNEGAKAIANALKMNKTLKVLSLNHNSIGVKGAMALANALKTNNTLTTLNLDGNEFGDDEKGCVKALAKAVTERRTYAFPHLTNAIGKAPGGDNGEAIFTRSLKMGTTILGVWLRATAREHEEESVHACETPSWNDASEDFTSEYDY